MVDPGFPEKIRNRTRHKSLEALRNHKRRSQKQHQAILNVLSNPNDQYMIHKYQLGQHSQSSSTSVPGNISFSKLHSGTINITTVPTSSNAQLTEK